MTVKQYIERKDILLNTPAIINSNGHFRLYKGKLIQETKFKNMFPLPVRLNLKKDNPDKTKQYLNV